LVLAVQVVLPQLQHLMVAILFFQLLHLLAVAAVAHKQGMD
jgi:hypothetical protein